MPAHAPQKFGLALANCSDASRVEQLNHWYSTIHVPDIISTEGFVRGTRYQLAGIPASGQRQFLALYEIQTDDPYRAINERQGADFGRYAKEAPARARHETLQMTDSGFFEQTSESPIWSPPGAGSEQPPRTLLLELRLCTDAGRLEEVEHWYNDVHLPAVAGVPGVSKTSVYRWPRPRDGKAQFLALYGTDGLEPVELEAAFDELVAREAAEAFTPDCLEFVTSGSYNYVSDLVKTWREWDDLGAWTANAGG